MAPNANQSVQNGGGAPVPPRQNPPAQPAQSPVNLPSPTPVARKNQQNQPKNQPPAKPEQTPKQLLVERVKESTNILVTVGKNPSVDQISSAIGLTLMLNKMDKHSTSVASGQIPAAVKFLKPEQVIRKNVDNLRDFIISLDKDKADKLRYKVEDNIVKIYITPYQNALSANDLVFTQGEINVELIIALGVNDKNDLDEAIAAHGKILHDATIITVNAGSKPGRLGSINWNEPTASSISEMLVSVSEAFQGGLLDQQISNSLLTGIVAATDKFSGDNTTPKVMTMSAQLMAAGADQHLIIDNLDKAAQEALQQKFATEKSKSNKKSHKNKKSKKNTQKRVAKKPEDGVEMFDFSHDKASVDSAPPKVSNAPSKPAPEQVAIVDPVTPKQPTAPKVKTSRIPDPTPVPVPAPTPPPEINLPPDTNPVVEKPTGPPTIKPEVSPGLVKKTSGEDVSLSDSIRPSPNTSTSNPNTLKVDPVTGKPSGPLENVPPPSVDVPELTKQKTAPVFSGTASTAAKKFQKSNNAPNNIASPVTPVNSPIDQNPSPPPSPVQQTVVDSGGSSLDAARNSVEEALRAAESGLSQQ